MMKHLFSVLLVISMLFSLFAMSTHATPTAEPHTSLVYQNSFDEKTPFALSPVEHGQTVNGFSIDFDAKNFIVSHGSGFYQGSLADGSQAVTLSDYSISMKVKGRNQNFAIIVRAASYNQFYAIGFSSAANQLRILKRVQTDNGVGNWSINSTGSDSFKVTSAVSLDESAWSKITVVCLQNTVSMYIENVLVATFTDDTYQTGSFGIRSYQGDLLVDDITVRSPDGTLLFGEDFNTVPNTAPLDGFISNVENGMSNRFTIQNGVLTGSGHILYNGKLIQNSPATALRSYTVSFRFKGSASFFTTVHAARNSDYQYEGGEVDPYYFYCIGLSNGKGRVLKRYQNSWPINTSETCTAAGDSITTQEVSIDTAAWNTATVTVNEHTIILTVNNTLAASINTAESDLSLDHGSFGFRSSDPNLMIDDLTVCAPDTELSSGDKLLDAYISYKRESNSEHALRFVMVTPLEEIRNYNSNGFRITVRFESQEGEKVLNGYLGNSLDGKLQYKLYHSVEAAGKRYSALYSYALFGCVITDIPDNAWDTVTLYITDTNTQTVVYSSEKIAYCDIIKE